MSANPHANGGLLLWDLCVCRIFVDYAVKVTKRARSWPSPPALMGNSLRDTMKLNMEGRNFRLLFSPDEKQPEPLARRLEVTNRTWMADVIPRRPPGRRMVGR